MIDNGEFMLSDSSAAIANTISGSGYVEVHGGTTTLTGSSNYSGGTVVDMGTLLVDNTSGSGTGSGGVTVAQEWGFYPNTACILGGTGSISGTVTLYGPYQISGGINSAYGVGCTLAPGGVNGSIGTLTVGNLDMESGSILSASINGTSVGTEMYTDMNITANWVQWDDSATPSTWPSMWTESYFYSMTSGALSSGEPVILTTSGDTTLVSSHAYTLISVSIDSSGDSIYVVRNPWGMAGGSFAPQTIYGYATLTFAQLKDEFGGIVLGTD